MNRPIGLARRCRWPRRMPASNPAAEDNFASASGRREGAGHYRSERCSVSFGCAANTNLQPGRRSRRLRRHRINLARPSRPLPQGTVVLDVDSGVVVPSFLGKPLRSAVESAQQSGLEINAIGSGIARQQWPAPGSSSAVRTKDHGAVHALVGGYRSSNPGSRSAFRSKVTVREQPACVLIAPMRASAKSPVLLLESYHGQKHLGFMFYHEQLNLQNALNSCGDFHMGEAIDAFKNPCNLRYHDGADEPGIALRKVPFDALGRLPQLCGSSSTI